MKKKTPQLSLEDIKDELRRVGAAGTIFVEGDLCRRAWKPHAETFMRGDDMDYNPEAVVPLKKTLLRLEQLFPCHTTLWRRRPDHPEAQEPLLYGSFASPDGIMKPPNRNYKLPPLSRELSIVFLKGKPAWKQKTGTDGSRGFELKKTRVAAGDIRKPVLLQHYVPIKDSLGEIAAALEIYVIAVPGSAK